MRIFTTISAAVAIVTLYSSSSQSQSFNCQQATRPSEIAICKHDDLSSLDENTAELYSRLVNTSSEKIVVAIRRDQARFLRERNKCGFDSDCIKAIYNARIAALCEGQVGLDEFCVDAPSPLTSNSASSEYPWLVKSQQELSFEECKRARRHDTYYWWARGQCHLREIRYAAGIVTEDTVALEDSSALLRKGEVVTAITQFHPTKAVYCMHVGYCYPAQSIRLLGSMTTGPDSYRMGDETDLWERVGSTCELRLKDRAAIISANAGFLLEGCRD